MRVAAHRGRSLLAYSAVAERGALRAASDNANVCAHLSASVMNPNVLHEDAEERARVSEDRGRCRDELQEAVQPENRENKSEKHSRDSKKP